MYERLAPGVLHELKKVIPKGKSGRRVAVLSQGLARNIGYPKLREHLGAVIAYMSMSRDYLTSWTSVIASGRSYGQIPLPFDYEPDPDDGKGM